MGAKRGVRANPPYGPAVTRKRFKKLLKLLIIGELRMTVSKLIDCKVHGYAAIQVKIWWIKHSCIAKQRPDVQHQIMIAVSTLSYAIERPYNNHLQ